MISGVMLRCIHKAFPYGKPEVVVHYAEKLQSALTEAPTNRERDFTLTTS